ncbi:DeoR/GlpR family DNA-binding transcription regulator [Brucella intermedia]|uniref:DeoR/GlpR family DNA-binding transcription regulator n=1 Tax=Brucella intermedia TaxID=94625 RepID=UPI000468A857|nr:DeoR/GlpR family DNA-binding transcription regulator [Brucella intermedia]PJR93167.1 DeoR/GlpR transcriptional regulator [Ochrobactrum sp. 721/2009]PJT15294.1 DeoR/GlpR transcriptional regulator [Ochrobactrum sp. 720/2009]PJT23249.1 DeoR/GlpR transcriptional regulator [Ochrobactrum sp. 715/2009]PJT29072.1 DeoR/GlpR transcriptional regulator [Ochrobactrum sp. 695/2009]PJT32578.1 DeoR/GlpR transcriptional regulator [Ochrobactrum sp. 689/2009]
MDLSDQAHKDITTTMSELSGPGGNKKEIRQQALLQWIENSHYVSLEEIAERFHVTTQTARRDIADLEHRGKVRKLHGGVSQLTPLDPVTYRQRRHDRADEKVRIAEAVVALIPDGATVFLDTGTTCEAIANALVSRERLHLVTYSLRSAAIISEKTDFTLAVPGGFVRPIDGGMFQEDTPEFIRRFKFDYAIISVSGIDDDGDLCDDDHTEVAVVSAALGQAAHKLLAVDSSKFGKRAMVKLGSVRDVTALVTNEMPAPILARILEEANIPVILS